jgi:hypothetical protein
MNDLQKLLSLRGISAKQIADATGENYHSVQKTIKGWRHSPHIQAAIGRHLEIEPEQLFGEGAERSLQRLIAQEIDRRAEGERARLRARYLHRPRRRIAEKRRAGNG